MGNPAHSNQSSPWQRTRPLATGRVLRDGLGSWQRETPLATGNAPSNAKRPIATGKVPSDGTRPLATNLTNDRP